MSWFARPMRCNQEMPDARLQGAGKGCRRGRDEPVNDNRDSPRRSSENQARQSCNFQATNCLKHVQRLQWVRMIHSNSPLDHLNFAPQPCIVQACAAPRYICGGPACQYCRDGTRRRGISDSHFACADERAPIVCRVIGQLDPHLERAVHFGRSHRGATSHVLGTMCDFLPQ